MYERVLCVVAPTKKALSWPCCVSLLSSVLKKKKSEGLNVYLLFSNSDPLLTAALPLWSQHQSLKALMLHLCYGSDTKGSKVNNTHLYSTAFNPDIPAWSLSVPKKGHSSYMKILKDTKSSYPTVLLIWFTLS